MTATNVIAQIKAMTARERRKVFHYVTTEAARHDEEFDRKALAEARRDPRPPVCWEDAKARLGLK